MESICKKCGRPLSKGELRYQVTIQVTSMFDGFMEIPEGDMEEEMERIIEAVRRHDPEELEKDVVQTISLVVCRACRNKLVREYDIKDPRVVH